MPVLEGQLYREGLNAARKELISKALATAHGNRSAAAKILGLEGKYLFKLIKSLGIE
jgi:DNA-binding NtrC family response regulator